MIRITKKTEGFEDVRWVARAAAKDPLRFNNKYVLNVIRSQDGEIAASDGYRLHLCEAHNIPDGTWEIIKNNQSEVILEELQGEPQFPEYEHLLVDSKKCTAFATIERMDIFERSLATIIRGLPDDLGINHNYLADTLSVGCHFDVFNETGIIQFINETHTALIMPIRL